jgi:hypothetical protein
VSERLKSFAIKDINGGLQLLEGIKFHDVTKLHPDYDNAANHYKAADPAMIQEVREVSGIAGDERRAKLAGDFTAQNKWVRLQTAQ